MRSQLVGPALALVREAGGDAGALIKRFQLPPSAETDAEVVLPLDRLQSFLDAAEIEARDPFLGIHVAQRIRRGAYGLLEFSCRSAPTVGEALRRIVRYISLLNELVEVTLVEGVIEQRIGGQPLCVGRHGNEFFLAMLLVHARQLSGKPLAPTRAWFAHPAPRDRSELVAVLGTENVSFDREKNGMALPKSVMETPLTTHDPALLELLDNQAEEALALRASPSRFLGQVRQQVRDALREGPPSLERAAETLRMSPRTLQRRLGDEGASYLELVDEVRQELARRWVGEASRPLGEVAFLLGYSELSAFLRAFKRWTGVSAGEFRVAPPVMKSGARGHRPRTRKGLDKRS
jgi:AraC-like DNA-binding protein